MNFCVHTDLQSYFTDFDNQPIDQASLYGQLKSRIQAPSSPFEDCGRYVMLFKHFQPLTQSWKSKELSNKVPTWRLSPPLFQWIPRSTKWAASSSTCLSSLTETKSQEQIKKKNLLNTCHIVSNLLQQDNSFNSVKSHSPS